MNCYQPLKLPKVKSAVAHRKVSKGSLGGGEMYGKSLTPISSRTNF